MQMSMYPRARPMSEVLIAAPANYDHDEQYESLVRECKARNPKVPLNVCRDVLNIHWAYGATELAVLQAAERDIPNYFCED